MDNIIQTEDLFKIPSDRLALLSEAKLYTTIPEILDIEYMVTEDEDTLYSNPLMDNGVVFNKLIEKKVKNNINVNDLLIGDFNQILVFLRKSAYGNLYNTKAFDPDTNTLVPQVVDLNNLNIANIGADFDENGEFAFVLPILNKRITFKLLTVGLGDYINTEAEKRKNKVTGVIPYLVTRFETQIMSIEGERNKLTISKFVKVMPPRDRIALANYIESIEPKVDLNYKFISTIKQVEYTDKIVLGLDFFYPQNLD